MWMCRTMRAEVLLRLFDARGTYQHIEAPTHDRGHTLDLAVTSDTTLRGRYEVGRLSDHKEIDF